MQGYPFSWAEIVLYIVPLVMYIVVDRFCGAYFTFIAQRFDYELSLELLFLPVMWVLIRCFSILNFGLDLGVFVLNLSFFFCLYFLYDHIKVIERFEYARYFQEVSRLIFRFYGGMLLALIAVRWWMTLFVG